MKYKLITLLTSIACITGCGSVSNTADTNKATNVVLQADQSKIIHVSVAELHESFLNRIETSAYASQVVEISGTVVAFALTDNNLYTITIRDNESDAICIFNTSISNQLGDDKPIHSGANLTVQGQCHGSGMLSVNTFTLNGCRIVTK